MESWNIADVDVTRHKPAVLASDGEGRVIVLELPAGEKLGDHQVHERAWVVVISGNVEITAGGETVSGGAGLLAAFAPNERHEVAASEDARLLLVLSPWPGVGHPSQPAS